MELTGHSIGRLRRPLNFDIEAVQSPVLMERRL
jgi:hypothetical protein